MVILYEVHSGLYVNMTNRCPCACTFCLRQEKDDMDGSGSLWLEREPTLGEIKAVKEKYDLPTRVNTNGLGDLINGVDTAPLYEGKIDTVSISLNTPDPQRYLEIVRPKFGEGSFEAMLKFAENVKNYAGKVVMTTVSGTISPAEEARCREICDKLGVTYRIRAFE